MEERMTRWEDSLIREIHKQLLIKKSGSHQRLPLFLISTSTTEQKIQDGKI